MNRSMHKNVSIAPSVGAQTLAADRTGAAVDLQGYDAATIAISVGVFTYSAGNEVAWKLEHSDASGSGFAAVAQADVVGATVGTGGAVLTDVAAVAAAKVVTLAYVGKKRYVRVIADQTGTTTTAVGAAYVIRGLPASLPVA